MRLGIVIMAAGKGTRLKSKRAKVLHEIGGRSLVKHVIASAAQVVPPHDILVIVGHQAEAVQYAVRDTGRSLRRADASSVAPATPFRSPSQGTRDYDELIVLSGDVPLLRPETIVALRDFHLQERAAMTILTAEPADPFGYGRVIRKSPKRRKSMRSSSRNLCARTSRTCARSTPASTPFAAKHCSSPSAN